MINLAAPLEPENAARQLLVRDGIGDGRIDLGQFGGFKAKGSCLRPCNRGGQEQAKKQHRRARSIPAAGLVAAHNEPNYLQSGDKKLVITLLASATLSPTLSPKWAAIPRTGRDR